MHKIEMRIDSDANGLQTRKIHQVYKNQPILGEHELKLRSESYVYGVPYYRRNVIGPAQVLAGRCRADQERFLDAM